MNTASAPDQATAYFWHGDALRSRSVSALVLQGQLDVPALPARLLADGARDIALHLDLARGDVASLSLARARTRWPQYRQCAQAVADWLDIQGLQQVLAGSAVALMACRGTRYHHDANQYGGKAFCNLFVSEDCGMDLHFPATGHCIPLVRGTALVFDTGQCHAVIARGGSGNPQAVKTEATGLDGAQLFLSWELPIEHTQVAKALQIDLDTDPLTASRLDEQQVWIQGKRVRVCPCPKR
ncbi:MAG: hypothetical protein WCO22_16900 [Betaproteobacteria bacterium]